MTQREKMVHISFDEVNASHTKLTVFIDGEDCGQLTLRNAKAIWFHHIIWKGCEALRFKWVASGHGPNEEHATDEEIDRLARRLSK